MKSFFTLIVLCIISFNAIHAEITSSLSDDGTLTISGTNMPHYGYPNYAPWYSQRDKIKKVVIENGVTNIGDHAFDDCSNISSIIIPNSVTSIGYGVLSGCSGLTSIIVEKGNSQYDNRNDCNAIIESHSNTLIAGCMNTIIPNSVTSIGDCAFYGCSGLASINIPESVMSIGSNAFYGCSNLTSITIPNSVTSIGNGAFYKTNWYNNQPNGLVYVGLCLYRYKGIMPANTRVEIKDGTKGIAGDAFNSYPNLISINIPNSVTNIGAWAFEGCSGLTSVIIPNSVTSIGGCAFEGCSGLTSITIPNSVTSIGANAFSLCSSLTSITIPESVTSIGEMAFFMCSNLTSITIPNSITCIEGSTFMGCSSLTSITIPNSVTNIGGMVFSGCTSLTSITIPESVTSIGYWAFNGCEGLTSITCEAIIPPDCGFACFSNVDKSIPVYVPAQSVDAYKAANEWKEFTNIQAISTTQIDDINISEISQIGKSSNIIFDLNGRMVNENNLKSGMYIKNGKKAVVK